MRCIKAQVNVLAVAKRSFIELFPSRRQDKF
jgi:hypothetical protein